MNLNDYKDGNGNVEVSENLVSDLIGGINTNESGITTVANTIVPKSGSDLVGTPRWARIATLQFANVTGAQGASPWGATITLQRLYGATVPEAWQLSLLVGWGGISSLKTINSIGTTKLYTRLRVVADLTTFQTHIDIYYNGSVGNTNMATIYPSLSWENATFESKNWGTATLPTNNQILLDTTLTA